MFKKKKKEKKNKTERAMEAGSTREEIVKWNQMTAWRFLTGVRRQTSPAPFWGTQTGTGRQIL